MTGKERRWSRIAVKEDKGGYAAWFTSYRPRRNRAACFAVMLAAVSLIGSIAAALGGGEKEPRNDE